MNKNITKKFRLAGALALVAAAAGMLIQPVLGAGSGEEGRAADELSAMLRNVGSDYANIRAQKRQSHLGKLTQWRDACRARVGVEDATTPANSTGLYKALADCRARHISDVGEEQERQRIIQAELAYLGGLKASINDIQAIQTTLDAISKRLEIVDGAIGPELGKADFDEMWNTLAFLGLQFEEMGYQSE